MTFRWVKYRTLHSSGPGRWDYYEAEIDPTKTEEENLDVALREIDAMETTQSEHWRGVEGDFEDPPREWLEKYVGYLSVDIKDTMETMARAVALIERS